MEPLQLIDAYIRQHSNFDTHRPYVGMSSINACPRSLYNQFFDGVVATDAGCRRSYQGYMYEREVKKILAACRLYRPDSERELTAPWDDRFRGHTDGEDCDAQLNEIKSMMPEKFKEVRATGKLSHPIFWQVQAYMLYGNYRKCTVWAVNTGFFEFHAIPVFANKTVQDRIEQKGKDIISAIDRRDPPVCLCGKCK